MENIIINNQTETSDGWQFEITLKNASAATSHTVTLTRDYWKKLTDEKLTPDELVRKSFQFLLEREPKESILSHFDLSVINTYFPEYEQTIATK